MTYVTVPSPYYDYQNIINSYQYSLNTEIHNNNHLRRCLEKARESEEKTKKLLLHLYALLGLDCKNYSDLKSLHDQTIHEITDITTLRSIIDDQAEEIRQLTSSKRSTRENP
jgi:hypothetical protein